MKFKIGDVVQIIDYQDIRFTQFINTIISFITLPSGNCCYFLKNNVFLWNEDELKLHDDFITVDEMEI